MRRTKKGEQARSKEEVNPIANRRQESAEKRGGVVKRKERGGLRR